MDDKYAEREEKSTKAEHSEYEAVPPAETLLTPPDGGYGWVILFASFVCNMLVDGVCFTFGLFYLEFLRYYGESKAKTAWVGSILNGMYLTMGPISGALAHTFGCRAVTITGSLLATTAYFISTYSSNVNVLIVTYGALGGIGFGLMYLPSIVMVGFYFEKRRAFATGIAVCGSGIGAFVFAPLCDRLLATYGWKGATWIIAGIVLNGVVVGALFRPLADGQRRRPPCDEEPRSPEIVANKCGRHKTRGKSIDEVLLHRKSNSNGTARPHGGSLRTLLTAEANCEKADIFLELSKSVDHITPARLAEYQNERQLKQNDMLRRKDIFYSGSLLALPGYRPSSERNGDVVGIRKSGNIFKAIIDTLRRMIDFSLLRNPVFCVYGLSCFLCMTGFFVPFIYLPDNAIGLGIPHESAAFLLSIIGIANTLTRVTTGWVSDRPWADCLFINNTALIVGGVATILCPFCTNYTLLAIYAAVFGAAIAVFVSLRSIIMVELMGIDRLTNAFGLVTLCQGMSSFIGAPISGALYDATGNYDMSFYMAGSTLMLAGLICCPLRRLAAWQHERTLTKDGRMTYRDSC